jgi:hypothetical protein
MKISTLFLTIVIFLFMCLPIHAQFKILAEGTSFEEPEHGTSKIVQLKNGNTFFLTVTEKAGIDYRIYDSNHKEIVASSVVPAYEVLKNWEVKSVFEVQNDVVLFISTREKTGLILYRLIFDASTGKLKEEKAILSVVKGGGAFVLVPNVFAVKQAPLGDSYAISVYDFYGDEKDKRIEIVQYGNDHKETNRTYLVTSDEDEFKWFVYMDMQVLDGDKVNVVLYNGKEKYFYNLKVGRIVMASIEGKAGKVTYSNIDVPEVERLFGSILTYYNANTKKMYLLISKLLKKSNGAWGYFLVNYSTLTNLSETKLVHNFDEKINNLYKERYSLKDNYWAPFKSFTVKDDGYYSILYEEEFCNTLYSGSKSYSNCFSGKIMEMSYDPSGKVLSGYIVPKLYTTNSYSQYKTALYLDAGKDKYILINDTERNNNVEKNNFVTIEGVSECDAFLYKLTGSELVPKREMLFGPNENGHNLASFGVSDFNGNTLVTLKLNKKNAKDKAVNLIWLEPQ